MFKREQFVNVTRRRDTRAVLAAIAVAGLQACSGALAGGRVGSLTPAVPYVVLTDGTSIELEVDPQRGGAIVYARAIDGTDRSPQMVDNTSPTGRQWQAAWWKGQNAPCSDADLCNQHCVGALNPTQAGDACARTSGGALLPMSMLTPRNQAVVNSRPRDFSSSNRLPLELQADVTIAGAGVVQLNYHVKNISDQPFGDDAWQNLPVLFTPPDFDVVTLDGRGALDDSQLPFENVVADVWRGEGPIDWVARSSAEGWTVLLYVPGRHPWSIGKPGAQSPGAGWMQPLVWQELQPGETGHATAWIVVGRTLEQARQRLGGIR